MMMPSFRPFFVCVCVCVFDEKRALNNTNKQNRGSDDMRVLTSSFSLFSSSFFKKDVVASKSSQTEKKKKKKTEI